LASGDACKEKGFLLRLQLLLIVILSLFGHYSILWIIPQLLAFCYYQIHEIVSVPNWAQPRAFTVAGTMKGTEGKGKGKR
jgi:4-hydroxybenzoate polyprenyltransferase